jgi:hypothetical protein
MLAQMPEIGDLFVDFENNIFIRAYPVKECSQ